MNRKLKSFIITLFIYIVIVVISIAIKIHLASIPERVITISLMEGKSLQKEKNMGNKADVNLGIGEGDIPLPYPKGKPVLPSPKKPVPPVSSTNRGNAKKPYSITGELAKRRLIKFVKPVYPKGNQEQTTVSLKIVVNKDGYITRINVIKTGGDAFDKNAVNAVREWRFQSLPPNETKNEEGIVNIYFILK